MVTRALWAPEHPVDADLATRLVGDLAPALSSVAPRHLGAGFDCDVWCFGDLAFRFPRRTFGRWSLEHELAVLPWLEVKASIPRPEIIGEATPEYPARFYGHRVVDGVTGDRAELSPESRLRCATQVAEFLRALHAQGPRDEARARLVPEDTLRKDVARRGQVALGLPGLERELSAYLSAPPPSLHGPGAALVHGDLYARHLVFRGHELSGVIDWGDSALGDPAVDLAILYTFFPPGSEDAFYSAYGETDEATRARALYFASTYGPILVAYADDVGDEALLAEGRRALAHARAHRAIACRPTA